MAPARRPVGFGLPLALSRIPSTTPLIQPKLSIDSPGDRFEREADAVADRVMQMAEPPPVTAVPAGIQRKCQECAEEEAVPRPRATLAAGQGLEVHEEEAGALFNVFAEAVQRKAEPGSATAAPSPVVADRLARAQSGGEPLAPATLHRMESAFGRDFSRVRVHRDGQAAELSRQLSARAFTHGSHIYFGSGTYDPEGAAGKRLLAHELAHVVQQGQAAPAGEVVSRIGAGAAQAAATPAIQRVATWAAPTVHETNSLADTGLVGTAAGNTIVIVNGAVGGGPLNGPTLTVTAVPAGGFDATVGTVPTNVCSADETVLSAGPWHRVAAKAAVGTRFPSLAQCTGAGDCNFRAIGDPTDVAMHAANRRHENHHVADGLVAFTGSVVPWDTQLTAAHAAGTTYHGATDAAARAALFTAVGGTEDQVLQAFAAAWNAAGLAFHATPAGGPIGPPTDITAAADCATASAKYTNPS